MQNIFFIIIAAALLAGLGVAVFFMICGFVRIWTVHLVRMTLLEEIAKRPESLGSSQQMQSLLQRIGPESIGPNRQNLLLTGAFLTVFGGIATFVGLTLRFGRIASGLYYGGLACIAAALFLCLAGLLARLFLRTRTS